MSRRRVINAESSSPLRSAEPRLRAVGAAPAVPGWWVVLVCCALFVAVWLAFGQTLSFDFVNFDDDTYVFDNPAVSAGVTRGGVRWAFTHTHSSNWHPLTWISHMVDCGIYGLNPGGHHLTSVLLHAAASILLFLVLLQMTTAIWRSAFVAMIFAVHPLRAESVAWISERKDVLSAVFFMLVLGAYVRYARQPGSVVRYLLVLVAFALGLMSKPMLVTVPAVLLLLDYWPLERLRRLDGTAGRRQAQDDGSTATRLIVEKLPLFGLAVLSGLVTLVAQRDALQPVEAMPLAARIRNAAVSSVAYVGDLVYPTGLTVARPYGEHADAAVLLAIAVLGAISVAALRWRRDRPYLLVGWMWYVVMLAPVMGLIQVGAQSRADRYTYLPQIGLCIATTWMVAEGTRGWRYRREVLAGAAAAVTLMLLVAARTQAGYWRDSESLWRHALAHTTGNSIAHSNLGAVLLQSGRTAEAMAQFEAALAIHPGHREAHVNLANALLSSGRVPEAIVHYRTAREIDPGHANAALGLGNALLAAGQIDDAITQLENAAQLAPDSALAHNNLGNALLRVGRVDEATRHYQAALAIDPGFAFAHNNLANALLQEGRSEDAIVHYRQAVALRPDYADAHHNLGLALFKAERVDDAITHYRAALAIKPDYAEAHNDLAVAYFQRGRVDDAIAQYREALKHDPQSVAVLDNLAQALATRPENSLRGGAEAVELAQRAVHLSGGTNAGALRTLAIAYAEVGRFDDAIQTARRAIGLTEADHQKALTDLLQADVRRYQAGRSRD